MIKAFNFKDKITTVEFIKGIVASSDNIDKRQAVILPTERSLRELSYSNFRYADLYTIKQISLFIRKSEKIYLPDELRIFYLRRAAIELCSNGEFTLFGDNSSGFLESLSSFKSISPAILSFYREIASELLELEDLYNAGLYTDYETQVRSLMMLWDRYIELIAIDGYTDRWQELKRININRDFIARYSRVIFVVPGYLTQSEIEELKIVGEISELYLIFTFVGKKDKRYTQYEKAFGVEIDDSYEISLSNSNCKIYETPSAISQLKVITSHAAYYNEKFNIPYNRMAVVLPDDALRRYFLELDSYELFDITGNEEISFSMVCQLLSQLKTIKLLRDNISYISITDLSKLLNSPFMKRMIDVESYLVGIKKDIRNGKLFIKIEDIADIKLVTDIDSLYKSDKVIPIDAIDIFARIVSSFKPFIYERERKSFNDIVTILERAKIIFRDIDIKISIDEAIEIILSIFNNLSIQTPKGQIAVSGILESRCLNYDIVFIIDLLDSYFPPKSKKELFLNTEMRKELNLPTFIDRDNLLKSYLLQLMAQARATVILYSKTDTSSRSRFIDELIFKYRLNIERYDSSYTSTKVTDIPYRFNNDKLIIYKTDEMIKQIQKLKISATSINTFHQCGLRFYLAYILSVREVDEVVEDISSMHIGTAFHKALELLKNDDNLLDNKERFILEFKKYFYESINSFHSYQFSHINKIMVNSCVLLADEIYNYEIKRRKDGYKTIATEYTVAVDNFNGFSLIGKVDRVDIRNNEYDIIDYKFKDAPINDITTVDDEHYYKMLDESFDNSKSDLQLPFYTLLLSKQDNRKVANAYHYILKGSVMVYHKFDTKRLSEFETYLKILLTRLLDKDTPFIAEQNADVCVYCLYRDICSR